MYPRQEREYGAVVIRNTQHTHVRSGAQSLIVVSTMIEAADLMPGDVLPDWPEHSAEVWSVTPGADDGWVTVELTVDGERHTRMVAEAHRVEVLRVVEHSPADSWGEL